MASISGNLDSARTASMLSDVMNSKASKEKQKEKSFARLFCEDRTADKEKEQWLQLAASLISEANSAEKEVVLPEIGRQLNARVVGANMHGSVKAS